MLRDLNSVLIFTGWKFKLPYVLIYILLLVNNRICLVHVGFRTDASHTYLLHHIIFNICPRPYFQSSRYLGKYASMPQGSIFTYFETSFLRHSSFKSMTFWVIIEILQNKILHNDLKWNIKKNRLNKGQFMSIIAFCWP